jgi:hypothetical protein
MTKAKVFVIAAALALALTGCSKGKKAKCEKGWDQMKDLMSAFAGAMDDKGGKAKDELASKMDEAKSEFMTECEKLPDDAVDCIADLSKAMTDPECEKKLKNFGGMGGKKKHSDDMKMDKDEPKKDEPKAEDKKEETK